MGDPHLVDLEGNLASPARPLKAEGKPPSRAPATICRSNEEGSVIGETQRNDPGAVSAEERKCCTLIDSIDFLQKDPLNLRMSLLPNQYLTGKGAEGAFCMVGDNSGGGLSEFAVRKPDSGWNQLGNTLSLCFDARPTLGVCRLGSHVGRLLPEFVAVRISDEPAWL